MHYNQPNTHDIIWNWITLKKDNLLEVLKTIPRVQSLTKKKSRRTENNTGGGGGGGADEQESQSDIAKDLNIRAKTALLND